MPTTKPNIKEILNINMLRVFDWMRKDNPVTGNKFTFKEALQAVWNNAPVLDGFWDEDIGNAKKN